jgi:HAE1 family hydrophobic/amphiphilic exporter-1
VGGATASLSTGGFGDEKQIQIQLRGPDIAVLNRLADQVMAEVKQVPGAVDVGLSTKGQKPELEVELNRGLAGSLGVTAGQVAQALRPAFAGIDAGDWVDPSARRATCTCAWPPRRGGAGQPGAAPARAAGAAGAGHHVPLGQVATVKRAGARADRPPGRERVITVQANTRGAAHRGDRRHRGAHRPDATPGRLPHHAGRRDGGPAEVFGRIFFALGVAVMLMYLILVVQFGSFLDPLAIMLSLPLSLIGVMLGLWVTGNTLNIMSMIGVILLMGIVAKNAILLIDFAKWAHERGRRCARR